MPPKTRASAISFTALVKLENARVPGRTSDVTVKPVSSPNTDARTNAAEPLMDACAEGYSGCEGVPLTKKFSQGSQVGSASPAVSPCRITVIGRQKTNRYLLSQQAITASAMVTFNSANRCAFCAIVKLRCAESCAATRSHVNGVFE